MSVHKTIELSDADAAYLARAVDEGRFPSASDAVSRALRLLADEESRLARLREAIAEGEASGFEDEDFDVEAFLEEARRED